jgi:hypothetical protein
MLGFGARERFAWIGNRAQKKIYELELLRQVMNWGLDIPMNDRLSCR